jgi:hypothetical protein
VPEDSQMDLSFANLKGKKVQAGFDAGAVTTDAGALLLREVDRRTGIVDRVVGALRDWRDPRYVVHGLCDLVRQRIFQIALGYEDADDADTLRTDPALKAACERLPVSGVDLASQPTLSRLENRVSRPQLMRLAYALGDAFIASFSTPPRELLLDLDDTGDTVHGNQQLALFNTHYGEYAYQPLHIYDGLSGRLVTTVLRPGCRAKGLDIVKILQRVVARLRAAWPEVDILVRGDSHFSVPEVHAFCRDHDVRFLLGQSPNSKLKALVEPTLAQAQALFDATREPEPVRLFTEFAYQADSWKEPLRIVAKAEVSSLGTNVRFVTTNLESSQPSFLYQKAYAGRGAMENYIKNHKTFLHSDRTSCHRFEANQFRLLLHSAAYMLLHAFQELLLYGTQLQRAYFNTLQQRLLKVAARVVERGTVIRIHLPTSFPLQEVYRLIDRRLHPAPS